MGRPTVGFLFRRTRCFKGVALSFLRRFSTEHLRIFVNQAPSFEGIDSTMHWINHTEVDNSIGVDSAYPVNSDL